MDEVVLSIDSVRYATSYHTLQDALARAYAAGKRPVCMCVDAGVEMYVARRRQYVVKRMPGSGNRHHPACGSYEPDASISGRGALSGSAILENAEGLIEARVGFPLSRVGGRTIARANPSERNDVVREDQRMSLNAILQLIFDHAGFNRWSPAMAGRRHQGVIQKYLMEAAEDILVKGEPLARRLYVPEAFDPGCKDAIAARRNERLAMTHPKAFGEGYELAMVIGEYKEARERTGMARISLRHMPDAPLLAEVKLWCKLTRKFQWMFDLVHATETEQARIVLCALIHCEQERVYRVDAATCMLTSRNWVPLDSAAQHDLASRLVLQQRRFLKPMRYDAKVSDVFPDFLLLDTGPTPCPLHLLSGFMSKEAYRAKEAVIGDAGNAVWVWHTQGAMPPLPAPKSKSV